MSARRPSLRAVALVLVVVAYALVTFGVAFRSPILSVDTDLVQLHLRHSHPGWHPWVKAVVIFGQRGPATLFFLPVFLWTAWRTRSTRPLVLLGTGLILLNVSVGIVKMAIGRLGPLRTTNAHDVFVGGNIYPSGHVSNTVVLYGLIAIIAVRGRRAVVTAAVALSVGVGLGTIYLDTHWFSDVLGGWLAGALVLLLLPTVMPATQRATDATLAAVRRRFARTPVAAEPPKRVPVLAPVRVGAPVGRVATGRHASVVRMAPVASVPRSQRLATAAARDPSDG